MEPRKKGSPWTLGRIDGVWKRVQQGADIDTLAKEHACTGRNLRARLKARGYDVAKHRTKARRADLRNELIYSRRKAGVEFVDIAVELGFEPTETSVRRLYMRLVRYCQRVGCVYPQPPRKKKPWREVMAQRNYRSKIIEALYEAAAESRRLTNTSLASQLAIPERELKAIIAELRRDRVLADGMVPTRAGIERVESNDCETKFCADVILSRVVKAWTSGAPCETLGSLDADPSFGFNHSTANLAIVTLRDRGLIELRGYLYLRKARA